ncbi:glycosyltransferase [Priestia endophytica]|uniref:glycosyltransferase n=1 Tax=Priestia endophytica TaxID=135735 RepID=UPI00124BF130|nr:glycosyltransferase [Priestia endophytica]KAB2494537.1 glycosyltransferase family 4 protein [Priestia endophytica]
MKIMFIVYHDIRKEARSQEILECAKTLSNETVLVSYSKPFNTQNIKCIVTGNGERNYFKFIKESIKAIKEENPDVVILHDDYTAAVLAWIHKFRKNIFIIYDSSELYIDRKPKSFKQFVARHMHYFEKFYLKHADVVISANIERGNIMKDYYKLKEKPIVFDNIHRIDDHYNEEQLDRKYSELFGDDKFKIVYGGGISKKRMSFELLEAVHSLGSNYRLIICGMLDAKDKSEFDSFISENSISDVHYVGFIPRSEWRYMLRKADISVSAFSKDTLNNVYCASGKLYESLFEGTPILTSENPPLKRICNNFGVGVSKDNFKEGILDLEQNYEVYCENIDAYTRTIDYEGRISNLAETLQKRIASTPSFNQSISD